jgi:hypothetical protein
MSRLRNRGKRRRRLRTYRPAPRDAWEAAEHAEQDGGRVDLPAMIRTEDELEHDLRTVVARTVLRETAEHVADGCVDESITHLRNVIEEGDGRDSRLAAVDLLRHVREVTKGSGDEPPSQHLHLHGRDVQQDRPEITNGNGSAAPQKKTVAGFLRRLAAQHDDTTG